MKRLDELFEVTYGNKFDLNKMVFTSKAAGGINFVGRSSQNHGVSEVVVPVVGSEPYDAGLITVALGGTKLLSSFVQQAPFYTAQNVAVLRPLRPMTFQQKLYVCLCIRHNRPRYSAFGREANRTIKSIVIPDLTNFPKWLTEDSVGSIEKLQASALNSSSQELNVIELKKFELGSIFDIKKGKRLTKANMISGNTPFIGATDSFNGVTARIGQEPIHTGGTISVSYNGSVAEAFYQSVPYWASDDVNVLYPKFEMTPAIAIFICALIRKEKYRFNYGRKWHLERMKTSTIGLPVDSTGEPDWGFMERYVGTLPFSSQL